MILQTSLYILCVFCQIISCNSSPYKVCQRRTEFTLIISYDRKSDKDDVALFDIILLFQKDRFRHQPETVLLKRSGIVEDLRIGHCVLLLSAVFVPVLMLRVGYVSVI